MWRKFLLPCLCALLLVKYTASRAPTTETTKDQLDIEVAHFCLEFSVKGKMLFKNALPDLSSQHNKSKIMLANVENIIEYINSVEEYEKKQPKPEELLPFDRINRIYHMLLFKQFFYIWDFNTTPERKTPEEYIFLKTTLEKYDYSHLKTEMLKDFSKLSNEWIKAMDQFSAGKTEEELKTEPDYEFYLKFKAEADNEKRFKMFIYVVEASTVDFNPSPQSF